MSKHKFLFKHSLPYTNFSTDKTSDDDPVQATTTLPSASVSDCQSQVQVIVNNEIQPLSSSSSIIIWNQNNKTTPFHHYNSQDQLIINPTSNDFEHIPEDQKDIDDDIGRISPLQPTYPRIEDCFSIDPSVSILTSLDNNQQEDIGDFYTFHNQSIEVHHTYVQIRNDTNHLEYSHDPVDDSRSNSNFVSNAQLYPVIVSQQSVLVEGQRSLPFSDPYIPDNVQTQSTTSQSNSHISSSSTATSCTTSVIKSTPTHRVGVITRCPERTTLPVSTEQSQQQEHVPEKVPSPKAPKTLNDNEQASSPVKLSSDNSNIIIHEGNPKYECKVCQRKFQSKNNFQYHIHDPNVKNFRYTCSTCNKGFIASTHYKYHLLTHTGERPFKCTEQGCTKDFVTAKKLARHMLIHKGDKTFKCDLCPKSFHFQKELDHHLVVHKGQEKYCCKLCSKKFTIRSLLLTHELTHAGKEKFPCSLCSKRFVRKQHLQNHLLIHTGEKAWKCEKCTKCFRRELSLNHHMKTHLDQRPFNCECGRGFVLQKDLIRHQNVHIGLAPFSCSEPKCQKKFRRQDNLKRHIKMHHSPGP